jgi:hypothetical protein
VLIWRCGSIKVLKKMRSESCGLRYVMKTKGFATVYIILDMALDHCTMTFVYIIRALYVRPKDSTCLSVDTPRRSNWLAYCRYYIRHRFSRFSLAQ